MTTRYLDPVVEEFAEASVLRVHCGAWPGGVPMGVAHGSVVAYATAYTHRVPWSRVEALFWLVSATGRPCKARQTAQDDRGDPFATSLR